MMKSTIRRLDLGEAHAYWRSPGDASNLPLEYLADNESNRLRGLSLISVFERHVRRSESILEIGCNAGRNLRDLFNAGYQNLSAVEINQAAVEVMRRFLPLVHGHANITVDSIENVIKGIPKGRHDVIFTMATLVHLPYESDWVLEEIAKRAKKKIILFECEAQEHDSVRHYPRQYRPTFERYGRLEIDHHCPVAGLPKSYVCRVFGPRPRPGGARRAATPGTASVGHE